MIEEKLARKAINGRLSRIKWIFCRAEKKRLVPSATYHALLAVEGLKRGDLSGDFRSFEFSQVSMI
jgi:hypothetical protein